MREIFRNSINLKIQVPAVNEGYFAGKSVTIIGHLAASFACGFLEDGASHVSVLVLSEAERFDAEELLYDADRFSVEVLPTQAVCENIIWINPVVDDDYSQYLYEIFQGNPNLCELRILCDIVEPSIESRLHTLGFSSAVEENGFFLCYKEPPRKRLRRAAIAPGSNEYSDAVLASITGMSLSSSPIIEEPPDSD